MGTISSSKPWTHTIYNNTDGAIEVTFNLVLAGDTVLQVKPGETAFADVGIACTREITIKGLADPVDKLSTLTQKRRNWNACREFYFVVQHEGWKRVEKTQAELRAQEAMHAKYHGYIQTTPNTSNDYQTGSFYKQGGYFTVSEK